MTQMCRLFSLAVLTIALGLAAAACGYTAPTAPYTPPVADSSYLIGSYSATVITSTDNNVTTDRLGAGASLSITINADHTTAGALVDGGETFDMVGVWTFDGTSVRITQDADTFVRVMRFVVTGSTLVGDGTFGGERFHVVLNVK